MSTNRTFNETASTAHGWTYDDEGTMSYVSNIDAMVHVHSPESIGRVWADGDTVRTPKEAANIVSGVGSGGTIVVHLDQACQLFLDAETARALAKYLTAAARAADKAAAVRA